MECLPAVWDDLEQSLYLARDQQAKASFLLSRLGCCFQLNGEGFAIGAFHKY